MENSQFETLKPSQNPPFNLPPLRRRPLQSVTYRKFVQILSYCSALQSLPQHQKQQVAEPNASVGQGEQENLLVQKTSSTDDTEEPIADGDLGVTQMEVDSLGPVNILEETNQKLKEDNNVFPADFFMKNVENNDIVDLISGHNESSNLAGSDKISPMIDQEVHKESFVEEISESFMSSLEMDMVTELSRPIELSDEKNSTVEKNMSEGIEHELKVKEKELEKLISTSGAGESSICVNADSDIEEGEISGDNGIYQEATNFLFDDDVSEEKQICEVIVDREMFACVGGEHKVGKHDVPSSHHANNIDNVSDSAQLERQSTRKDPNANCEIVGPEGDTEIRNANKYDNILGNEQVSDQVSGSKETHGLNDSLKYLAPHGDTITKNMKESKDFEPTEKDASVSKKKRKGPLSKERKAKKKKKERIKRAEKNRKLGVKRLKLQPVVKPKKVAYCRHYLKGRCQEGEKCKFSHDTIPLTKSQPCCHFARHSCMKGDDCPFDHQLSKYPCNNYATKGFCSRGADCLFSHEIPAKESSSTTSNVLKPESKCALLMNDPTSYKQVNLHGKTHQQFDAKLCNTENFSGESKERKVAEFTRRPAGVPKGISVLSHLRSSGNTSQHKEPTLPLTRHDGVKVGHAAISLSESVQKSNEIAKGVPKMKPKGINFLSFGKAPLKDTGSNKEQIVDGSFLGELNKANLFGSSLNGDSGFRFERFNGGSLSESEPNTNKTSHSVSPASTSQGMNFVSLPKVPFENDGAVRQEGLLHYKINSAPPINEERENACDGFKSSTVMPNGLASYSNPFRLSMQQSGSEDSAGISSLKLPNTPSSMPKALQSTLAFASKFDAGIQLKQPICTPVFMTEFNQQDILN